MYWTNAGKRLLDTGHVFTKVLSSPSPGSMRLSNHLAASALRATAKWDLIPSTLLLQPLEAGWTGIQPTTIVMLQQFLLNYIKQVSHTTPSVLRSLWRQTQHKAKQKR